MSQCRKLFSVLVILLRHQEKRFGVQEETWIAFLSLCNKLATLKSGSSKQREQIGKESLECLPMRERTSFVHKNEFQPSSGLVGLPQELLTHILEYIEPNDCSIFNLLLTNKRLYYMMLPLLHSKPYLTSPTSISKFVKAMNAGIIKEKIAAIIFGPTMSTGLRDTIENTTAKFEFIPFVHSGLFSYLINNRNSPLAIKNLVHPIFYEFAKCIPKETLLQEYVCHKEPQVTTTYGKAARKSFRIGKSRLLIRKIDSNSATLQLLVQGCSQWYTNFPEWANMSIFEAIEVTILLLDWFQGDFHPVWQLVGGEVVRAVKSLVMAKVRDILTHVYKTLILQVRFVTNNSQRLLDSYCLIYYRVLSSAQTLNMDSLARAMNIGERTKGLVFNQNTIRDQYMREVEGADRISMSDETPTLLSVESTNETTATQHVARLAYSALLSIYHARIPPEMINSSRFPPVQFDFLSSIIMVFPPSSTNLETVEFINTIINSSSIIPSADMEVLAPWIQYFKEVVNWYESSLEMDPVKDLLRKSMDKIDNLRSIQVYYY